ncbi:MAG: SDR family NAD(P)-dependent oxidoreductase, partial [Alphaproteobacteria bacterium]|nr:SDR family NAD(P)-dependent oxidoreductase [Alphaproteobacteria bacterium]
MKLSSDIAAIVTGAGSGLGAAVASRLASAGVKVALFDKDTQKGLAQAEAISGLFVEVDVSDATSVATAITAAREAHGQERLVINCAGIA